MKNPAHVVCSKRRKQPLFFVMLHLQRGPLAISLEEPVTSLSIESLPQWRLVTPGAHPDNSWVKTVEGQINELPVHTHHFVDAVRHDDYFSVLSAELPLQRRWPASIAVAPSAVADHRLP